MASTTTLTLSMPVGLPSGGADPTAYFALLETKIEAQVSAADLLSVWTDPADDYSGVYLMIKAAVAHVPVGGAGLDGLPVATPTLLCRTWIWEYTSLQSAGGGSSVAVIGYANLDAAAVETDVTTELTTNAAYSSLTSDERTQAIADFMAGTSLLLVEAGTRLGRAEVDASRADGYRRADITLYDSNGTVLDPAFYFSLWGTIGGTDVDGHPLVTLVAGPISPAMAPIEGGIRVKVTGTGFTDASTLQIGGASATDVRASADGTALYGTVPAAAAGTVDVIADATTYTGVFAYVEDVVATAQAVSESMILHIQEIKDRADALTAAGTLDDDARADLTVELEGILLAGGDTAWTRSYNTGAAAFDTDAGEALAAGSSTIQTLLEEAAAAIG